MGTYGSDSVANSQNPIRRNVTYSDGKSKNFCSSGSFKMCSAPSDIGYDQVEKTRNRKKSKKSKKGT